jgi:hypothetical protein
MMVYARLAFVLASALVTASSVAHASDANVGHPLNISLPATRVADATPSDSALLSNGGNSNADPDGSYFDDWFARVAEAQASQPHWMTPLATVTPRLEEEVRYDQYWEHLGTGANVETYGSGKGLELIPTTTNEILINAPTYEDRTVKKPANGWGDWPLLTVKQRLISSPEDQGNYIVSAFLGVQAPTGSPAFTNHAWLITPTLAAGKGWGDFDVQATVGAPIPTSHGNTIGIPIVTNVAFQYHLGKYFWPEFEVNDTYWTSGEREGKNQMFLTPGVILGRFDLFWRVRFIVGVGYQFAVEPKLTTTPALTPTYNHAWIMTVRTAF